MKFLNYWIHRKEQWDLECNPIICIHKFYDNGNGCKRVFCLYFKNWKIKVCIIERHIKINKRRLNNDKF